MRELNHKGGNFMKINKEFMGFVIASLIVYGATQLIPQAKNLGGWAIVLLMFWLAWKISKSN